MAGGGGANLSHTPSMQRSQRLFLALPSDTQHNNFPDAGSSTYHGRVTKHTAGCKGAWLLIAQATNHEPHTLQSGYPTPSTPARHMRALREKGMLLCSRGRDKSSRARGCYKIKNVFIVIRCRERFSMITFLAASYCTN